MAVETRVQVTMPQMGESVTEGVVLQWHVKEGDTVAADDVLVEISTDKVDAEVPSPASGTVVSIVAGDGETVSVGAVLCEIESGDAPEASSPPDAVQDSPPGADGPGKMIEVTMPQMGESVTEGTVLEWAKSVGDSIEADETLVEISTDKVDAEVPSPTTGTIVEILVAAGDTVSVGQVLARLESSTGASSNGRGAVAPTPSEAPAQANGNGSAPSAAPVPDDVTATPVARRVAAAEGVDLARVAGTGPQGRITKTDVTGHTRTQSVGRGETAAA
ncbi:MAG: 2-oxoglutarate dehydrogenase, subunit, partial [Solirubrobacterales bacterium]|nr:2-oxoglutarate dehydrogenase, subunit [Solirubrobacterales bacterium]